MLCILQSPPSRNWTRRKAIHGFNDPLRETCHDSFETDCSIKEFNSKFNELAIGEERPSEMVKLAGESLFLYKCTDNIIATFMS